MNVSGALALAFVADGNLTFSRKHGLRKKTIYVRMSFLRLISFLRPCMHLKAIRDLLKET